MISFFSLVTWFYVGPASALGAADFNLYLEQPIDTRVKQFRAASTAGESYLRARAFDPKAPLQMRWRAVTTLGRLDAVRFRPELERALQSREWFMRNAALIALQTADRATAVRWSMRLVTDPALIVRTQAVRNLVQLNARESEALLWKEIFSPRNFRGHESLWVRAHMAEALAKFASPGRARGFERLLEEPDERLYRWAIQGLEATTGFKMTDARESITARRAQWLARLGHDSI